MFAQDKLDLILRRYDELGEKLSSGADGQTFVALSRERATLDEVVAAILAWRAAQREVDDLAALAADPALDADMRALAEAEAGPAEAKRTAAE